MSDLKDLIIRAWDKSPSCPDSVYVTNTCPSCLAEQLEPLLKVYVAQQQLEKAGLARSSEKATSKDAAQLITAKATTARIRLLMAHGEHPNGLIDEEAAQFAGLSPLSEYRTRCSELMRSGCLEDLEETRASSQGVPNVVRRITDLGLSILREREERMIEVHS